MWLMCFMYTSMCFSDIFPLKSFSVLHIYVFILTNLSLSLSLSLPLSPSLPLSLSLSLSVPPLASLITLSNYSVPIGQSIKLLVHFIGGYPPPTVSWYRLLGVSNSNRIPINDTRASQSGLHSLNLTITNSTLNDDGLYLLVINNSIGSIELVFNVTILGKCINISDTCTCT